MKVFSSDDHLNHHSIELDRCRLIPSWDSPDRAQIVYRALQDRHDMTGLELSRPDMTPSDLVDWAVVERVHRPEFIEFLRTAWDRWVEIPNAGPAAMASCWPARRLDQDTVPSGILAQLGYYGFSADCSIVAGTWGAASASVALAQAATKTVIDGARVAFALCRPPGHHASIDQFGGYCYINNAAVAAQQMLDAGYKRVAVLDVDYHHGNGTQDIFYDRDDVLYCSIHGDPNSEYPFYLGHAGEAGTGPGLGFNHNEPLPHGTGFDLWSAALDRCIAKLHQTECDALVVSLGLDTYELDPISHFKLTTANFDTIGATLAGIGLPTSIIFEGGYAVDDLGRNVAAVLDGFERAAQGV